MSTADRPTRSLLPFLPRVTIEWARREDATSWQLIDGSMLFVDISGFTKMSERLARHGKRRRRGGDRGGRDAASAACSRSPTRAGGSLLKFGGDALLILFTGERHAARAADVRRSRCTSGSRHIGRIDTSAGRVTLRMSAGRALGHVRLLPRRRVAPRADPRRAGREHRRGDGGHGERGAGGGEPRDRRGARTAPRRSPPRPRLPPAARRGARRGGPGAARARRRAPAARRLRAGGDPPPRAERRRRTRAPAGVHRVLPLRRHRRAHARRGPRRRRRRARRSRDRSCSARSTAPASRSSPATSTTTAAS